jgi:aconitate hydratase
VRFVLAESYERIHRSNLVGMGVLPLEFKPGDTAASLGLTGRETFFVRGLADGVTPRLVVDVEARPDDGTSVVFGATVRIDAPAEVEYYSRGGILRMVLGDMLAASS